MKILRLGVGVILAFMLAGCRPDGMTLPTIGSTGGTVSTADNLAKLIIPSGTFSSPVAISLQKVVVPSPDPLEYTAIAGGGFEIKAPAAFTASQTVTLQVEDSALTLANGQRLTPQAVPAGSIVVALAQRPEDSSPVMLPVQRAEITVQRVVPAWQVTLSKELVCFACRIWYSFFTPTRISINVPDLAEGGSATATLTAFDKNGNSVSPNNVTPTWSSLDTSIATVNSSGLVTGVKLGSTIIRAVVTNLVPAEDALTVIAKPVVFTADFNGGIIRGYSRGQLASSGIPVPAITVTLPTGSKPNDLEFDAALNLWVTDNANNQLLRLSPNQYSTTNSPTPSVIISANSGSINEPVGLAFDSSNNLWVANKTSLVRFTAASLAASGAPAPDKTITGVSINFPGGIAFDSSNNLWVAMFGTNKVHRWIPAEQTGTTAPSITISPSLQPAGLTFDSSGNLFVGQIGGAATSGVSVYSAPISNNASAVRTLGTGATNNVYGVAFDANTGGVWANNQGAGELIGFSSSSLSTNAVAPTVKIGGATQANLGYGGVATLPNSNPANPPPSISSFTVNPPNLGSGGGNVTFSWVVTGASSLSINNGVGTVTGSSRVQNVSTTTSFTLTATNAFGSTVSSPVTVTVAVLGRKLWHASFRENLIRGYAYNEAAGTVAAAPTTTLNLAACGANIYPNSVIQDNAGNIIFSAPVQNKVVRIDSSLVAQNGTVNITAAQCKTLISGHGDYIGFALDTDGRSFFAGSQSGVRYAKYNAGSDSYADVNMPILNTVYKISGLHLIGNRLYAVDHIDFAGSVDGKVRVYDLDQNRIADASLRLTFQPTGNNFRLPEGIAIAENRLWVANNSGDNLMGFALADIDANLKAANSVAAKANSALAFKAINTTAGTSNMHCPGGIATAPNGELWVNVQGANAADCGNFGSSLGNVFKYSKADLNGANNAPASSLQISGIVSVPGFGGLFFGK